ncbi:MAG TPA: hypothetical protein VEH29_01870 [Acidimicrobiales bacterium]|nr:hypothetical protein [Acidimicrobiales bacterium]
MSDVSQGPGWWQASDYKWYPPESHPDAASSVSLKEAETTLPPTTETSPSSAAGVAPAAGWVSPAPETDAWIRDLQLLASPSAAPPPSLAADDDFTLHVNPSAPPRRRRRGLATALAAVGGATLLAASLVIALGGGAKADAQAAVLKAVNSTLTGRTADVTLSLTGTVGSSAITSSGSGSIDFTQNAMQMDMLLESAGQQETVNEIYVGGTIYEAVPGMERVTPGKSWISLDMAAIAHAGGNGSTDGLASETDPTTMLRLLSEEGNSVVALGPSTVDGTAVQGFSVSVSPSKLRSDLAAANLPSWMRQALSYLNFEALNFKVYVDGQGLLQSESVSTSLSVGSTSMSLAETLEFSDYGTPVTVAAPPASEVISLQQFLQDAEANSGAAP